MPVNAWYLGPLIKLYNMNAIQNAKGPVPLHLWMQRGCKTYKNLAIRCVLIAYMFHTLYPSSIRPLRLHPREKF